MFCNIARSVPFELFCFTPDEAIIRNSLPHLKDLISSALNEFTLLSKFSVFRSCEFMSDLSVDHMTKRCGVVHRPQIRQVKNSLPSP